VNPATGTEVIHGAEAVSAVVTATARAVVTAK